MATRKHTHEEVFPISPARLFALLHAPSAIRGWWRAARAIVLPQRGGIWAAAWGEPEDDPDYITAATIREFDPPRRLVLADSATTPERAAPVRANFVTEFVVEPHPEGALLRFDQDGFPPGPDADAFYAACGKGWTGAFFAGICRYLGDL